MSLKRQAAMSPVTTDLLCRFALANQHTLACQDTRCSGIAVSGSIQSTLLVVVRRKIYHYILWVDLRNVYMLGSDEKETQDVMVWASILSVIPDVERWNRNLPEFKRLTDQYGPECRAFIASEAKRRGYEYDRDLKAYRVPWKMFALKGRNLIAAGWQDGTLRVAFAGKDGAKFWRYKGVPEAEFEKLKRVPYPDKLFTTNVKNKGYEATKE